MLSKIYLFCILLPVFLCMIFGLFISGSLEAYVVHVYFSSFPQMYFLSNLGVQYILPFGSSSGENHELENPPVDLAQKNSP